MRKSEFYTRLTMALLVLAALVAIVLQIMNERTNAIETTYEIITFSVALIAVMLAVLQGLSNVKTTRELTKITKEIRDLMDHVERDERRDGALKREIRRDLDLDLEAIKIMKGVSRDE